MKYFLATLIGIPVTVIGCVLFCGGVAPVEGFLHRSFYVSYGFDLLIWMPVCLILGWIVLESIGYET